jgi:hypothetical protein
MKNFLQCSWVVLFVITLSACAHGKIGRVSQELDRSLFTKDTPIVIETVHAKDMAVSGDDAQNQIRIDAEVSFIESAYGKLIARDLSNLGYKAEFSTKPVTHGLVLSGRVNRFEHGSESARIWVGMGAGSSNLYTGFILEDRTQKKIIAQFEVISTSGGEGGIAGASEFMQTQVNDGAKKTAEYLTSDGKRQTKSYSN